MATDYHLHVPVSTDVANVPADFQRLVTDVSTALDMKLDKDISAPAPGDVPANYQKKIIVQEGTTAPSPANHNDGDIIFLIAPQ